MTDLRKFLKRLRERFIVHAPARLRKMVYRTPVDWEQLTFSEKVQWRCQNPDPDVNYALLIDKYCVKDFVRPWFRSAKTYAVIENAGELNCDSLPTTFVMKTTHSWSRSMLVEDGIIRGQNRNKEMNGVPANKTNLQAVAQTWLRPHSRRPFNEIQYRFVRPRILFEEYLFPIERELQFFLFYGECKIIMVLEREFDHTRGSKHRFYDENWTRLAPGSSQNALRYDNSPAETPAPGEAVMQKLKKICRTIDHVRVDLYVHAGDLYFSEFTFTHARGNKSNLGRHEIEIGRYWRARR